MGRKPAVTPQTGIWWYSYWRFLRAHLAAPPAGTQLDRIADGRVELKYRGRRGIGISLLGLGFTGGLAFIWSGVVLLATALGASPDQAKVFQATVICGICFPFFLMSLRGVDELLRRRRIDINEGVVTVAQGGLFVHSSGWSVPTSLILGVGLYDMPHVGVGIGGTTQVGADWHVVDLALRHRRHGPLVLFVTRDRDEAEALRDRICAALDCAALEPPGSARGPTLRYLLTSIALALAPTALSLIAVGVADGGS